MNRQQRREQMREERREALKIPLHKRQKMMADAEARARLLTQLVQNGITPEDLKQEYDKGYKAAQRQLSNYYMRFFYAATAIATHRLYKHGRERVLRTIEAVHQIMTEEITTTDILQRCIEETGIDLEKDLFT